MCTRPPAFAHVLSVLCASALLSLPTPAAGQCVDYTSYLKFIYRPDVSLPTAFGGAFRLDLSEGRRVTGGVVEDGPRFSFHYAVEDISDPGAPFTIATGSSGGDIAALFGLAMEWPHVFSTNEALSQQGFFVHDASDGLAYRGGLDCCDGKIEAIGDIVLRLGSTIQVIDVSDPTNPSLGGVVAADTRDVAAGASDTIAFAAVDDPPALRVIGLGDPLAPAVVGSATAPIINARHVAWAADRAFLGGDSTLAIYDALDPTAPTLAGQLSFPGPVWGVAASATHAFVAEASRDVVFAVDVSNPALPVVVGGVAVRLDINEIKIDGAGNVHISDGGLYVLDMDNLNSLLPEGELVFGALPTAVAVAAAGDFAYVSAGTSLFSVDITDPAQPAVAGSVIVAGTGRDIALSGDFAYVVYEDGGLSGLQVVEVTDPTMPGVRGSLQTLGDARSVDVAGSQAFVADTGDLAIIDVSNPDLLLPAGSLPMGEATSVDVDAGHAVVVDGDSLHVVVVAVPAIVGSRFLSGGRSVSLRDQQAVVTTGTFLIGAGEPAYVVDISTPTSPQVVGSTDVNGTGAAVDVAGDHAYIADDTAWGLHAVDLSDPTDPTVAGEVMILDGTAHALATSADHVFVLSEQSLLVYPQHCPQVIGVSEPAGVPAAAVVLHQNRPNPFNPSTAIAFEVNGAGARVTLRVYSAAGRVVRTLLDDVPLAGGLHEIDWDGRDDEARAMASGAYVVRLEMDGQTVARKLTLVR